MDRPLKAPTGTPPGAAAAVDAGNSLFEAGQWEQAKGQYESALIAHSTLAEAHYDLALVLDQLGRKAEAMAHYKRGGKPGPRESGDLECASVSEV
jgi:tetratricopeptide (TPR) repeat protein